MEDALVQCVQLSLANCLTSNATFYAEQLVAVSRQNEDDTPSEHSLHLLAMCYIQSGRHSLALDALKGCSSHKNLYLKAVAALALNLNREAEIALQPGCNIIKDEDYKEVPNGAYGIYLLGVVKRRQGATHAAISHFKKALELNPLLWAAFEALCQMGAPVETSSFFGVDEAQLSLLQTSAQNPLLPTLQAPTNAIKGTKTISAASAAVRAIPAPKPISTPDLAKKMRSIMSPGELEHTQDSVRTSLSRRLFETPSTPADSMIGIAASSTPLWAPGRTARPVPQPIAVSFPDLSSTRPTRTSAATPASSLPISSAITPARSSSALAAPPTRTISTIAASPKKKLPPSTTTMRTTTASKASAATPSGPAPTPRRAASSLGTSTSTTTGSSAVASTPVVGTSTKVTGRVMPARAAKAKSSVSAALMTPIPTSLPSSSGTTASTTSVAATVGAAGASTPTTPPVTAAPVKGAAPAPKASQAGPPALPSHRTRSQQFKVTSAVPMGSTPSEEADAFKTVPLALSFATGTTPAASTAPVAQKVLAVAEEEEPVGIFKEPLFKTHSAPKDSTLPASSQVSTQSSNNSQSTSEDFTLASNLGSKISSSSGATTSAPNPDDGGDDDSGDDSWVKGMSALLALLRMMGEATKKMEFYECRGALTEFSKLPILSRTSSYALASIGRCYYELAEHERAREVFSRLHLEWPFSKLNTVLYSNVLWHLRSKADLSALAHQQIKLEPRNADSWCTLGNAYSLDGDSENALNAFQRAAQVNPDHAYAYTLAGHEYLLLEDFDSARASFIEAAKVDPRHYRGWYGLGLMYFKMNEVDQAKAYFKKAHLIFPKSSVLYAWMGMCEAALGDARQAVIHLKSAVSLSPENSKAKYHLASMLVSVAITDRTLGLQAAFQTSLQAAERYFSQLKMTISRSAALHFLNARILAAQNKKEESEHEFSIAKELDPKVLEHIGEDISSYDPPEIA